MSILEIEEEMRIDPYFKVLLEKLSWRPIETAPKDQMIMLWQTGWATGREGYWQEGCGRGAWHLSRNDPMVQPELWLPLPERPQSRLGSEPYTPAENRGRAA